MSATSAAIAANIIATIALMASIAVYFLGKRHTNRLFASKEYPELVVRGLDVWGPQSHLKDLLRYGKKRLGYSRQIPDHRSRLVLEIENPTNIKAIDVYIRLTLAHQGRRVQWFAHRGLKLEPTEQTRLQCALNYPLSQCSPTIFHCRDMGPGEFAKCRWLEVIPESRLSFTRFLIEIGWRAPLADSPVLRKWISGQIEAVLLKESLQPDVDQFGRQDGTPMDLGDRTAVLNWKLTKKTSHRQRPMAWRLKAINIEPATDIDGA